MLNDAVVRQPSTNLRTWTCFFKTGLIAMGLLCSALTVPTQLRADEFLFDSILEDNVWVTVPDVGGSGPWHWNIQANGSGGITHSGDNHLTVAATGTASSAIQLDETDHDGGGRNGDASVIAEASGSWRYSGKGGESPSVAMIVNLGCSGTIIIHGLEGYTGNSVSSSGAAGSATAIASISPPDTNTSGSIVVESVSGSLPTTTSSGCTSITFQNARTDSGLTWNNYGATNDFSISCHQTYLTTPGTSTITASTHISCEATSSLLGYPGSTLGARVWGDANASATASGGADIKLDQ